MSKNFTHPFNKLKPELPEGPARLFFGTTNAKLIGMKTATFALPAGYTCPGAKDCLAWFDRDENKIKDGPDSEFRCFAASGEAAFSSVRRSVDRNLAILQRAGTAKAMHAAIDMAMPAKFFENIRVHPDGDYFSQAYFQAWMMTAQANPSRLFYGYTKNLPLWIKFRSEMPENMVLTASWGGKWDNLIEPNKLRSARVVFHPDEAEKMGLEIDHDDSHARSRDGRDFSLLIHNTQPAGSTASAAIKRLKAEKIQYSYSKKK